MIFLVCQSGDNSQCGILISKVIRQGKQTLFSVFITAEQVLPYYSAHHLGILVTSHRSSATATVTSRQYSTAT